jgi:S-DNA-T family DNA segregation ATPase FtsK/SpoIIIE
MFISMIIGSVPRMGKTVVLRLLLLIAALDPRVELLVFELKGTGDMSPLATVAHRYRSGDDDPDIAYVVAALREAQKDLRRRAAKIRSLPRDLCPEFKVTPQLADNRSLGLHPVVIGIDECQRLFEHPEYGADAAAICEDLVRRGPAVGIITILATQRPDAKALPTGITAAAIMRLCLKVMGWQENNMILGTGAHQRGIQATAFSFNDKGIGLLAGEGEEPQTVRIANIDGVVADRIAARARSLREKYGQLTGYAANNDTINTDTSAHRSTLLADLLAVFPANHDKAWNDTLVDRLAKLRPEVYGAWATLDTGSKAAQLTAVLKPYNITSTQTWGTDPATGQGANRRGITRADITRAAVDHKNKISD